MDGASEQPRVPPGYEILRVLGRGGTGTVYLARHTSSGQELALKVLVLEADETRLKRFEVEASVGRMLDHPNIIRVFDCGTVGDQGWIAMERLEGFELSFARTDPSFGLEDRIRVIMKVALALQHAHERDIIHRDVKPSNIYLTHDGGVKLLDFGIARLKANKITKTGFIVGTPQYMSPEQISAVAIDKRSDIFSLGVVAYELLAGSLPWQGENHTQIMMAICSKPPRPFRANCDTERFELKDAEVEMLHSVVHRGIQQEPRHRYSDMEEMALAFKTFRDRTASDLEAAVASGGVSIDPNEWMKRRIDWAVARAARQRAEDGLDAPMPREPSSPPYVIPTDTDEGVGRRPSILWIALLVLFASGLGVVVWLALTTE